MSPILFCIYMDELLIRLEKAGIGCYIGWEFMGAFSYADDLSILAPSVTALRKMLRICEDYAFEYNVIFNGSKSQMVHFNGANIKVYLNGVEIPVCSSAVHLGSVIGYRSSYENMHNAKCEMVYQTNLIMSRHGYCDSSVLMRLFTSYCSSYYGSHLWDLSEKGMKDLKTQWRKCMRRIMKIHPHTRSRYIPLLAEQTEVQEMLLERFSKFIEKCRASSNTKVKVVTTLLEYSYSTVGNNLREFGYRQHCKRDGLVSHEDLCTVGVIKELMCVTKGQLSLPFFNTETESLLEYLCVN